MIKILLAAFGHSLKTLARRGEGLSGFIAYQAIFKSLDSKDITVTLDSDQEVWMNKYSGSCLCGRVAFEILGEFESFYLCHCKYCQKDTGSAHAANLFSSNATLTWITGADYVKYFNLPSTRHEKNFCCECGSALPKSQMEGKLVVIPAGSLDCDITIKPDAHIFYSSKASWEHDFESIKKYEILP